MGEFNWTRALDALGRGHDLGPIGQARQLARAFGVEGPIPLHPLEEREIEQLRQRAANNLAAADRIEARVTDDATVPGPDVP
jgi:hypothetical protein